jgi:hypothetical protein
MTFKQAEREPDDGGVWLRRIKDDQGRERIQFGCGEQVIECSEYNAARLFGMLALTLEVPLSKEVRKAINFGDKTLMEIG